MVFDQEGRAVSGPPRAGGRLVGLPQPRAVVDPSGDQSARTAVHPVDHTLLEKWRAVGTIDRSFRLAPPEDLRFQRLPVQLQHGGHVADPAGEEVVS